MKFSILISTLVSPIFSGLLQVGQLLKSQCNQLKLMATKDNPVFQPDGPCYGINNTTEQVDIRRGRPKIPGYRTGIPEDVDDFDTWQFNYVREQLGDYGCYCYFKTFSKSGQGRPKSELDNICKYWQDAYKCIQLDYENKDSNCVPKTVQYNYQLCSTEYAMSDESNCARDTCKADLAFVRMVLMSNLSILQGYDRNVKHSKLKHSLDFDSKTQCQSTDHSKRHIHNGIPTPLQCCGKHPVKSDYSKITRKGHNNWFTLPCSRRPYNPERRTCCANGDVQNFGTCEEDEELRFVSVPKKVVEETLVFDGDESNSFKFDDYYTESDDDLHLYSDDMDMDWSSEMNIFE